MRFLILVVILFVVEIIFIQITKQFKVIDISKEYNFDSCGTVRGGGIIFFFSVALSFVSFNKFVNPRIVATGPLKL